MLGSLPLRHTDSPFGRMTASDCLAIARALHVRPQEAYRDEGQPECGRRHTDPFRSPTSPDHHTAHCPGTIANGLASAEGSVQAAADRIAGIVAATMALRLLISSPSRVTARLGAFAGEGLADVLRGAIGQVTAASAALGIAAIPDLGSGQLIPSLAGATGNGGLVSLPAGSTTRGGGDIHVHLGGITIEGNVTAEDDLTLKMVRAVNQGISEATTQLRRSLGVTWRLARPDAPYR